MENARFARGSGKKTSTFQGLIFLSGISAGLGLSSGKNYIFFTNRALLSMKNRSYSLTARDAWSGLHLHSIASSVSAGGREADAKSCALQAGAIWGGAFSGSKAGCRSRPIMMGVSLLHLRKHNRAARK
jgi:hypothetical protein